MTDNRPTTGPSRQDMLKAISEACVMANPKGSWRACECDRCSICMSKYNRRPIRLADVLLAIPSPERYEDRVQIGLLGTDGILRLHVKIYPDEGAGFHTKYGDWNLRRDSLDDQSDECLAFLHDLLC